MQCVFAGCEFSGVLEIQGGVWGAFSRGCRVLGHLFSCQAASTCIKECCCCWYRGPGSYSTLSSGSTHIHKQVLSVIQLLCNSQISKKLTTSFSDLR